MEQQCSSPLNPFDVVLPELPHAAGGDVGDHHQAQVPGGEEAGAVGAHPRALQLAQIGQGLLEGEGGAGWRGQRRQWHATSA